LISLLRLIFEYQRKLQGFGTVIDKSEAVYREFVSAVMLAAVLLVPGTRLDAGRNVDGDNNSGRVDYAVLKNAELVCITEAKESDIKQGFAMNLTQCDGSLQV